MRALKKLRVATDLVGPARAAEQLAESEPELASIAMRRS